MEAKDLKAASTEELVKELLSRFSAGIIYGIHVGIGDGKTSVSSAFTGDYHTVLGCAEAGKMEMCYHMESMRKKQEVVDKFNMLRVLSGTDSKIGSGC